MQSIQKQDFSSPATKSNQMFDLLGASQLGAAGLPNSPQTGLNLQSASAYSSLWSADQADDDAINAQYRSMFGAGSLAEQKRPVGDRTPGTLASSSSADGSIQHSTLSPSLTSPSPPGVTRTLSSSSAFGLSPSLTPSREPSLFSSLSRTMTPPPLSSSWSPRQSFYSSPSASIFADYLELPASDEPLILPPTFQPPSSSSNLSDTESSGSITVPARMGSSAHKRKGVMPNITPVPHPRSTSPSRIVASKRQRTIQLRRHFEMQKQALGFLLDTNSSTSSRPSDLDLLGSTLPNMPDRNTVIGTYTSPPPPQPPATQMGPSSASSVASIDNSLSSSFPEAQISQQALQPTSQSQSSLAVATPVSELAPEAGLLNQSAASQSQPPVVAAHARLPRPADGEGTSCHQCKLRKPMSELIFCSRSYNMKTKWGKRKCQKKFCRACLKRCYNEEVPDSEIRNWMCVCCRDICTCAVCRRRKTSALVNDAVGLKNLLSSSGGGDNPVADSQLAAAVAAAAAAAAAGASGVGNTGAGSLAAASAAAAAAAAGASASIAAASGAGNAPAGVTPTSSLDANFVALGNALAAKIPPGANAKHATAAMAASMAYFLELMKSPPESPGSPVRSPMPNMAQSASASTPGSASGPAVNNLSMNVMNMNVMHMPGYAPGVNMGPPTIKPELSTSPRQVLSTSPSHVGRRLTNSPTTFSFRQSSQSPTPFELSPQQSAHELLQQELERQQQQMQQQQQQHAQAGGLSFSSLGQSQLPHQL